MTIAPEDFLANIHKKMPSKITEVSADRETEAYEKSKTITSNSNSISKQLFKSNEGQTSQFGQNVYASHERFLESLI